jgi:hypothetical protein
MADQREAARRLKEINGCDSDLEFCCTLDGLCESDLEGCCAAAAADDDEAE